MPAPRILEGPEAIAEGVRALASGNPVAFPTETVYGLGADATDASAVERVFRMKGRPSHNPLIVHVSGPEMAQSVAADWPIAAKQLAHAHWPGPLTLVLPKADSIPPIVNAGGPTVAVRCPDHPVALALIEAFGKPIVGPSANPSGRVSPTTAHHVAAGFPDHDLAVIDGGPCRAGIESTVLDLTSDQPAILRPGVLGQSRLSHTLGIGVLPAPAHWHPHAKSPGLLGPHYQPRAPVTLAESAPDPLPPDAVLITHSQPPSDRAIRMPTDLTAYAAGLYAALHRADALASQLGADRIIVETPCVTDHPMDAAIRDAVMERLARAAS